MDLTALEINGQRYLVRRITEARKRLPRPGPEHEDMIKGRRQTPITVRVSGEVDKELCKKPDLQKIIWTTYRDDGSAFSIEETAFVTKITQVRNANGEVQTMMKLSVMGLRKAYTGNTP